MTRQLEKYLRTRATLTPWQLSGSDRSDFRAAVIVPALTERESLPQTLATLASNPAAQLKQTLIVVVVNNRSDTADEQILENQQTLNWLRSKPYPELNLAWVDASSKGMELPAKEGVGLARKLGFDLALSRLAWNRNPRLISLDADTLVDENYLPAIFTHFDHSTKGGATIPFRHQAGETDAQEAAIRRYELYLRSYLFGLQLAGSPYAYHTIGSAFACRADAYVAAGGMNRRPAAEDFYFLQQLAKTTGVEMLRGTLVKPSPRCSGRVPFGTGRAVQAQVEEQETTFEFCPAEAFAVLKQWLQLVEETWDRPVAFLLKQCAELSAELTDFLVALKLAEQWAKLQSQHAGKEQFMTSFHAWFDGLRTRQLLGRWAKKLSEDAEQDLVVDLLKWGGQKTGVRELAPLLKQLEAEQNG